MSALERSRRLVTTFVALILYSASAWRLRQLNRLMNPPPKKKGIEYWSHSSYPARIQRYSRSGYPAQQVNQDVTRRNYPGKAL
jgi:hypothetical protein